MADNEALLSNGENPSRKEKEKSVLIQKEKNRTEATDKPANISEITAWYALDLQKKR